jgi:hypothetical protein
MTQIFSWRDVSPDYGVLELDDDPPAPARPLGLHVMVTPDSPATLAWWELDDGRLVRFAEVGAA